MLSRSRISAILFFVSSILFMHLTDVLIKYSAQELVSIQALVIRFATESVLILPFFLKRSSGLALNGASSSILLRSVSLALATVCWFMGVPDTPITLVTGFAFLIPIVTLILAVMVLNEKTNSSVWLANILGFIGVGIIVKFHLAGLSTKSLFYLSAGVVLFGLNGVFSKKCMLAVDLLTVMQCSSVGICLCLLPWALSTWQPLAWDGYAVMIILGLLTTGTSYCLLRAYQLETVSFLTPFMYLEAFFTCLSGHYLFGESIGVYTFLGLLVVFGANILSIAPSGNINLGLRIAKNRLNFTGAAQ